MTHDDHRIPPDCRGWPTVQQRRDYEAQDDGWIDREHYDEFYAPDKRKEEADDE